MAYFEMTEEEFLDEMVLWQVSALLEAEEERSWVDAIKTALGGVPGQIGVMVNGEKRMATSTAAIAYMLKFCQTAFANAER